MVCHVTAVVFFFQAEDGIRDHCVTGVQTCALPIWRHDLAGIIGEVMTPVGMPARASAAIASKRLRGVEARGSRVRARSPSSVVTDRSEERRVGKECRSRGSPYH